MMGKYKDIRGIRARRPAQISADSEQTICDQADDDKGNIGDSRNSNN